MGVEHAFSRIWFLSDRHQIKLVCIITCKHEKMEHYENNCTFYLKIGTQNQIFVTKGSANICLDHLRLLQSKKSWFFLVRHQVTDEQSIVYNL